MRWREECDLADRIIANSVWSQNLLAQSGIDRSKMEVIPLALEDSKLGVQSNRAKVPGKPLRLLFLGQTNVRKGIKDLVAAARLLTGDQWHIDAVGAHGTLPRGLPNNLTFHGSLPRSEVTRWYSQADVFILPTHSDGFALTQLEAMAQELPVITTSCCGDVVDDSVNGWIIPPGDPEALASLLSKIAGDPSCLTPMRDAALKTLPKFSLERIGRSLIQND
jgi:glycosyltransferase involved in cell wall biosynthesis